MRHDSIDAQRGQHANHVISVVAADGFWPPLTQPSTVAVAVCIRDASRIELVRGKVERGSAEEIAVAIHDVCHMMPDTHRRSQCSRWGEVINYSLMCFRR